MLYHFKMYNFAFFSCTRSSDDDEYHDAVRPITMDDLLTSLKKMRSSKVHTGSLNLSKLDLD